MGPFRKCSCLTATRERKARFKPRSVGGHTIGPFVVLIHEAGCLGQKGGSDVKVWLIECKGSSKAKKHFNHHLHPYADHRGEFLMDNHDLQLLRDATKINEWGRAFDIIGAALDKYDAENCVVELDRFPAWKASA